MDYHQCRINQAQIIAVINKALRLIDPRLVDHGERVAYIAYQICARQKELKIDMGKLLILSVFHDVGAYKTEEIDDMLSFENDSVWNHCIYGYQFLKNMTPLGDSAQAVLYHHLPYSLYHHIQSDYLHYASAIHLADRFDLLFGENGDFDLQLLNDDTQFDPKFIALLQSADQDGSLRHALKNGDYSKWARQLAAQIPLTEQDTISYLKMLVYSIDFRSEHTVTHTISTMAFSMQLCWRSGLTQDQCDYVYFASLLHDIGKIAIPVSILEHPGKLSKEQMDVMKTHILSTEEIIGDLVNKNIVQIATRHHEKLNGSGYPRGLFAQDLTTPQRILAIADILSALTGTRSYKKPFPKEQTLSILANMAQFGQLDSDLCALVAREYDEILQEVHKKCVPIIDLYRMLSKDYQSKLDLLKKLGATDYHS